MPKRAQSRADASIWLDPSGLPDASNSIVTLRMPSGPNNSCRANRSTSDARPPAALRIRCERMMVVAVIVIPGAAGRRRELDALGIGGHVGFHEFHPVDRLERRAERGLERTAERKPCGVAQQMIDRDRTPSDRRRLAMPRPAPADRASARPCARECRSAPRSPIWSRRSRGSAYRCRSPRRSARRRRGRPSRPPPPWCAQRRLFGLGKGAIERRGQLRIGRRDRPRARDIGQQRRRWLDIAAAPRYRRPHRHDRDSSRNLRDRPRGCGRSRATSPWHPSARGRPDSPAPR